MDTQTLPKDIFNEISILLDVKDLVQFSIACKFFEEISSNPNLWRNLCFKDFELEIEFPVEPWNIIYQKRFSMEKFLGRKAKIHYVGNISANSGKKGDIIMIGNSKAIYLGDDKFLSISEIEKCDPRMQLLPVITEFPIGYWSELSNKSSLNHVWFDAVPYLDEIIKNVKIIPYCIETYFTVNYFTIDIIIPDCISTVDDLLTLSEQERNKELRIIYSSRMYETDGFIGYQDTLFLVLETYKYDDVETLDFFEQAAKNNDLEEYAHRAKRVDPVDFEVSWFYEHRMEVEFWINYENIYLDLSDIIIIPLEWDDLFYVAMERDDLKFEIKDDIIYEFLQKLFGLTQEEKILSKITFLIEQGGRNKAKETVEKIKNLINNPEQEDMDKQKINNRIKTIMNDSRCTDNQRNYFFGLLDMLERY